MTLAELQRIYTRPFFDLMECARSAFSSHWNRSEVQLCTLLSIKTGGCSEDCAYCAQSARYQTGVRAERLLNLKVSTHSYADRLDTIRAVQQANISVCCGGIIGMGETELDRLKMLEVLTNFDPPPESVPINCLMPMPGTPLENQPPIDIFELIRLIATTRIALPEAKVRLSAGRTRLSKEAQALCLFAGANSIFYGDKLLTAENPAVDQDRELLSALDLAPQPPFAAVRE
jgi:biotin synthase-like enzyme